MEKESTQAQAKELAQDLLIYAQALLNSKAATLTQGCWLEKAQKAIHGHMAQLQQEGIVRLP